MRAVLGKAFAGLLLIGAALVIPSGPAFAAGLPLISSQDGRCLDSDIATPTHDGTKAQTWQCTGGLNQAWTWYPDGSIRSSWDSRCLDEDVSGGTHNGTKVQVWYCNGWLNQKWHH